MSPERDDHSPESVVRGSGSALYVSAKSLDSPVHGLIFNKIGGFLAV